VIALPDVADEVATSRSWPRSRRSSAPTRRAAARPCSQHQAGEQQGDRGCETVRGHYRAVRRIQTRLYLKCL
jgi:hypothetical protein